MALIEADEVLKELKRHHSEELKARRFPTAWAFNVAIEVIKNASKSVNEVRHSDWVQDGTKIRCLSCNYTVDEKGLIATEVCPCCGCIMDGGGEK